MKKNEEKTERIGSVLLNLNYYSGEDQYSEGASEDQLLEIVKTHRESEFEHVIEESRSWSVMYHLSHIRENIATWLPMEGKENVLEIGSGCGAVTGMLTRLAGHVTCIDLSKKRSQINAYRHRDRDNLEIIVGNFKDIEPELDEEYDYVTLIGVLEYADLYIGGENAFTNMLKTAASHLKKGGRLFIAIENKYGLKYFAGCREDHTGRYYEGIEGYGRSFGVKTFGKGTLTEMLADAGLNGTFYYPYPDYKLPHTVYSDEYLPHKGELTTNIRNYDADRMVTFDEGKVFDSLIADHRFPEFSNSYAVIARRNEDVQEEEERPLYVKFSNERAQQFRIATMITRDADGKRHVYKEAIDLKSNRHVRGISENYEELLKIYADTKLKPNRCTLLESREREEQIIGVSNMARDRVELEYVSGITLEKYLDKLNATKQYGRMSALLKEFAALLYTTCGQGEFRMSEDFRRIFGTPEFPEAYKASPVCNYDMIFSNIVLDAEKPEESEWQVLDYEWMFRFHVPAKFLLYRALFYYEREREETGFFKYLAEQDKNIYTEFSINSTETDIFREMEHRFQIYIINGMASMEVLKVIMPTHAVRVDQILRESNYLRDLNAPKTYYSCGDGFAPENIMLLPALVEDDNVVTLEVPITNNIVSLRIDPTEYPCFLHVEEIRLKMQKGMDRSIERFVTNGYPVSESTFLFDTDDAQIILDIPAGAKKLTVRYQVKMLPRPFYEDFSRLLREKCLQEDRKPTIIDRAAVKLKLTDRKILPEGFRYNDCQKKRGE
ncbi:MAG: class I SAM-dependent methyltransferase [Lachnospiraceae bacterium]|nr:class I SAM-dependent methyltransferase [Lachnospiraceae bacterium]